MLATLSDPGADSLPNTVLTSRSCRPPIATGPSPPPTPPSEGSCSWVDSLVGDVDLRFTPVSRSTTTGPESMYRKNVLSGGAEAQDLEVDSRAEAADRVHSTFPSEPCTLSKRKAAVNLMPEAGRSSSRLLNDPTLINYSMALILTS